VIDTSSLQVTATLNTQSLPAGIAISSAGLRAYYTTQGALHILDVNPASPQYNQQIGVIGPHPQLFASYIGISPNGRRMVLAWFSVSGQGTDVFDIDPAGGNYLQIISSPLPLVASGSSHGVAISPDGSRAYARALTTPGVGLGVIDLASGTVGAKYENGGGYGLVVTPDGAILIACGPNWIRVHDTSNLAVLGNLTVGNGFDCAITPDGSELILMGTSTQVWVMPLM